VTGEFVEVYWKALKTFSDKQLTDAAELVMNDPNIKSFPAPGKIREVIAPDESKNKSFDTREGYCFECGKTGTTVSIIPGEKPKCRRCYSGITVEEHKERVQDLSRMQSDKKFWPDWAREVTGRAER
jgi:hypothetical protein